MSQSGELSCVGLYGEAEGPKRQAGQLEVETESEIQANRDKTEESKAWIHDGDKWRWTDG